MYISELVESNTKFPSSFKRKKSRICTETSVVNHLNMGQRELPTPSRATHFSINLRKPFFFSCHHIILFFTQRTYV